MEWYTKERLKEIADNIIKRQKEQEDPTTWNELDVHGNFPRRLKTVWIKDINGIKAKAKGIGHILINTYILKIEWELEVESNIDLCNITLWKPLKQTKKIKL